MKSELVSVKPLEVHFASFPVKKFTVVKVFCFSSHIQSGANHVIRFLLVSLCSINFLMVGAISNSQAETVVTPSATLATNKDIGNEFQLEVRQMPLVQVLKEVSTKTGIPLHYSVLPEGLITATCVGESLKPVLECLLNRKADIIVRYSNGKTTNIKNGKIAEAWVLGSKLEAVTNSALCTSEGKHGSMNLNVAQQGDNNDTKTKPDQSDYLLKIVQTGNPTERAEAIGNLLAIGAPNDPKVKAILEEAVHDQNDNVRAQAISTLTHRDDYNENAKAIIQEALQDSSVDVRMMAVDGITDDVGLLQQAANDSDETISAYATQKLEELSKQQTKRQ